MVEWYWQGKPKNAERETCPHACLSTTNPTWNDQGVNSGLRGEKPENDCLRHGTAETLRSSDMLVSTHKFTWRWNSNTNIQNFTAVKSSYLKILYVQFKINFLVGL
jgi:hypothetical protein